MELHHFSDASKDAYGQCSYLRLINHSGQIHCFLVMAKSRVAPLKPVTIPRLELTAALVSVKTDAILCRELEYSGPTARSSLGMFPTMHVISMSLSPTEFNRYGTAHHLVSGSTWKQLRMPQTMLRKRLYAHNLSLLEIRKP